MDIGTGLTVLGSAVGGKDLIIKMLGPTADYIGDGMRDFALKRVENIRDVFQNASKKIGDKIENNGIIHPKVLQGILNEASYADNSLAKEYFGGVLASSRTGTSRDDRGAFFISLVSRLSNYQIRLHYIFYLALKKEFNGNMINWGIKDKRTKLRLYIPYSLFKQLMDFSEDENEKFDILLDHSINGLIKEQLIDSWYNYGTINYLKPCFPEVSENGLILQPSNLGFELFYWVLGRGQENPREFLYEEIIIEDDKFNIDNSIKRISQSLLE